MILSKLKIYLFAGAAMLLTALLATVKLLARKNSRLERRVETAEANLNHARVVALKDTETDQSTASHRADLINELEDTGDSSAFNDPNKLWNDFND